MSEGVSPNGPAVGKERELADRLARCEQAEALGKLAREVAHDFGNLLTIISGNVELIESSLRGDERAMQQLRDLRYATEEAGDLIQGVLSFTELGIAEPTLCDLRQLVQDAFQRNLFSNFLGRCLIL